MRRTRSLDAERQRLRRWLALFFIALTIPTGILIRQAYSQLKWEAFHQHQVLAEAFANRINTKLGEWIDREEARSFADYGFVVIKGASGFLQRSPLSAYPVRSEIPGLVGYFQVDADGSFSTPLLPRPISQSARYGIFADERKRRAALQNRVQRILSSNRLLRGAAPKAIAKAKAALEKRQNAAPASEDLSAGLATRAMPEADLAAAAPAEIPQAPQSAFDQLKQSAPRRKDQPLQLAPQSLGRVEDLKLDAPYRQPAARNNTRALEQPRLAPSRKRTARKEISALAEATVPDLKAQPRDAAPAPTTPPIRTFESELDPFEFSRLDSGDFVLYRKVWRDARRYIQGAVIARQAFVQELFEAAFRNSALSQMSKLGVAYQGEVMAAFSGRPKQRNLASASELSGALLYRTRLSAPLADLELILTITQLPAGPGAQVITWAAVILALLLCGGFYLMYRLGAQQIALARQQQDFVSAVSHELRTPLTSIRMYGEILREGWASEDRKKTYYDYIYSESERLSRLIANVLQLARMNRNELQIKLVPVSLAELMNMLRSKVASQIEQAGFELRIELADDLASTRVPMDADAFSQIVINLVDNAIKFSSQANHKIIEIAWRRRRDGHLQFSVRDYGPGIARDQMKKIFRLFYRPENELTRETVGTGIGLALVRQLALAMGGRVDVTNTSPGAEFSIRF